MTTEVLYDSTGYPQDSSYSAVEPQYTIEGREVEQTIVDFVPESPSASGDDDDNFRKNAVEEELRYHAKNARENGRGRRKKKGKNRKNKKGDRSHAVVDEREREVEEEEEEDTYSEIPETTQEFDPEDEDEIHFVLEDLPEGYPTDRFMERGSNSNYSRLDLRP